METGRAEVGAPGALLVFTGGKGLLLMWMCVYTMRAAQGCVPCAFPLFVEAGELVSLLDGAGVLHVRAKQALTLFVVMQ